MKKVGAILLTLALTLCACIFAVDAPVEAAAKLSAKKVTLEVGASKKIKVKGTKKSATWASDNTKVATVKSGKITAKGEGKCTVTAKVGSKTLKCSVTVVAKSSAFDTTVKVGSVTFPASKAWTEMKVASAPSGVDMAQYNIDNTSFILLESVNIPAGTISASDINKENISLIGQMFVESIANSISSSDVKTDVVSDGGVLYGKAVGTGKSNGVSISYVMYYKITTSNFIVTASMQMGNKVSSDLADLTFDACKQAK